MKSVVLAAISAFLLAGCATGRANHSPDTTEIVLAAPSDKVKAALVQVLEGSGYSVRERGDQEGVISTGYREEIPTIWNWLLVSRFGVGRSYVNAIMTPENQETTRLTIQVIYEAKTYLWSLWKESTPPLQWNSAIQLRRVKRVLGLL
ncbi:MAG: hypothetical protein C4293_15115 [Nitrospiraceae bacterium]